MICQFSGDYMGVFHNENHAIFEWRGKGKVVFSFTRHGNALSGHFAAEKKALKEAHKAISECAKFVFDACKWCEMILCCVKSGMRGVEKTLKRAGFSVVLESEDHIIYMMVR